MFHIAFNEARVSGYTLIQGVPTRPDLLDAVARALRMRPEAISINGADVTLVETGALLCTIVDGPPTNFEDNHLRRRLRNTITSFGGRVEDRKLIVELLLYELMTWAKKQGISRAAILTRVGQIYDAIPAQAADEDPPPPPPPGDVVSDHPPA